MKTMRLPHTAQQKRIFNVLLFLFFIIIGLVLSANAAAVQETRKLVEKQEDACPPHAWVWRDMKNSRGEKVGEHIVCTRCGPASLNRGGQDERD